VITNEPLIEKQQVIILDLNEDRTEYLWGIVPVMFAINIDY